MRISQPGYIGEVLHVDSKALSLTASSTELIPLANAIDQYEQANTTSSDFIGLLSRYLRLYMVPVKSRVNLYAVVPYLHLGLWTSSATYAAEAYAELGFMYYRDGYLYGTGLKTQSTTVSSASTTESPKYVRNLYVRGGWDAEPGDVVVIYLNIYARTTGTATAYCKIYHDPATAGNQLPLATHMFLTRR
jgi:hypothetical protein